MSALKFVFSIRTCIYLLNYGNPFNFNCWFFKARDLSEIHLRESRMLAFRVHAFRIKLTCARLSTIMRENGNNNVVIKARFHYGKRRECY